MTDPRNPPPSPEHPPGADPLITKGDLVDFGLETGLAFAGPLTAAGLGAALGAVVAAAIFFKTSGLVTALLVTVPGGGIGAVLGLLVYLGWRFVGSIL
ncbi:MAG: hypothetical protein KDA25_08625 [Phycisphaerales bacterium]|nr:hypothetical protein [Phycisphaerales bacterium]